MSNNQSAQPCGCDPGAHYLCAKHKWELEHHINQFDDDGAPHLPEEEPLLPFDEPPGMYTDDPGGEAQYLPTQADLDTAYEEEIEFFTEDPGQDDDDA